MKSISIALPHKWEDMKPLERMQMLQDIQSKVDTIRHRLAELRQTNMRLSLLKEEMTRNLQ